MSQFGSIYSVHGYYAIFTKNVTLGITESFKVLSKAIWSAFTMFLPSEALLLAYIKQAGLLNIYQPFDLIFLTLTFYPYLIG